MREGECGRAEEVREEANKQSIVVGKGGPLIELMEVERERERELGW